MNFNWTKNSFDTLSANQLYQILQLRSRVFVVEQESIYQDIDQRDQLCLHLCAWKDDQLAAYCRLFRAGDYFDNASIGRVVVAPEFRRLGLGNELMLRAIGLIETEYKEKRLTLSAQLYLKVFYENHGFRQDSEPYLEDGIPHLRMKREGE